VDVRIIAACAVVGALLAGGVTALGERDYQARSFVIRVPPRLGGPRGIELARGDRVLRRALALAGDARREPAWLRRHSHVEITSRGDVAITVRVPDRVESAELATAYAKAFRRSIPAVPGLATRGRGARDSAPELGPLGWALFGAAGGLFVGAALAIARDGLSRGSRRGARPASAPCAPARRSTPG
jgi:hypothetical protein